jgi:hypothetical protein
MLFITLNLINAKIDININKYKYTYEKYITHQLWFSPMV